MLAFIRNHKLAAWVLAMIAACGIAVAVSELSGQSNKTCADAGINGAAMEMNSLDTIKQSESNPVDWQQERRLRHAIDAADQKYAGLVRKAQGEIDSNGSVTASTRSAGLSCAQDFMKASETYARFWDQNNGKTRANLARQAGKTRVANAQMTFNDINSDNIDAYNDECDALADARSDYMEEAKTDVSESDRQALKDELLPRLEKVSSNLISLSNQVSNLLSQVKDQLGSGGVGGLVSCARQAAESDNPSASLLSPLTGLLSLVQSMASDVKSLSDDISSL